MLGRGMLALSVALVLLSFSGVPGGVAAVQMPAETRGDESAVEPAWLVGKSLHPTWASGIGYLVENRCVGCHQPGGEAPMSFGTYGDVQAWAKQIRITVSTGNMPPNESSSGSPSGQRLSARELDLFDQWAAAGFPKGDGEYAALRGGAVADLNSPASSDRTVPVASKRNSRPGNARHDWPASRLRRDSMTRWQLSIHSELQR